MMTPDTLDILSVAVAFTTALTLCALVLRQYWLSSAAALGMLIAVWQTLVLFADPFDGTLSYIGFMFGTMLTIPTTMTWLVQGATIGVIAAAIHHFVIKDRLPKSISAVLICALAAPVPLVLHLRERAVPSSTCGQSYLDVRMGDTHLRLVPQLDLFFDPATGSSYRYSTAPDAIGSIAEICRTFPTDPPVVQSISTGVFWREDPTASVPLNINGILSITLLDPATTDTSPATRMALFNYTSENAQIDPASHACSIGGGTTRCLIWQTLPSGVYVELQTGTTTTSVPDLLNQAATTFNWLQSTWIQSPESP